MEMTRYILIKFAAYALWSFVGLRLLTQPPPVLKRLVLPALGLGGLRLLMGMGFGVAVFLFAGLLPIHGTLRDYIAIYAPVRIVEWGLLFAIIRSRGGALSWRNPRVWIWIVVGIAVSFAADLASPIPPKEHFCIGRCLC